jgi:hypothetical protein
MSYIDIVICVGPLPYLETWPPIYRGQERTVRDRLRISQSSPYVYFRYTLCLTDFTFDFIRRPIPPILSPSYWTFVELTLVNWRCSYILSSGARAQALKFGQSKLSGRGKVVLLVWVFLYKYFLVIINFIFCLKNSIWHRLGNSGMFCMSPST